MYAPGGPNSFIFMQFLAKKRLAHPLWELAPTLRKILDAKLCTSLSQKSNSVAPAMCIFLIALEVECGFLEKLPAFKQHLL